RHSLYEPSQPETPWLWCIWQMHSVQVGWMARRNSPCQLSRGRHAPAQHIPLRHEQGTVGPHRLLVGRDQADGGGGSTAEVQKLAREHGPAFGTFSRLVWQGASCSIRCWWIT